MATNGTVYDPVSDPRHPFGLPLGTIRGCLSLLIVGFFWVVLLWPESQPAKPMLGHYFMMALVLLSFSPYSQAGARPADGPQFLPFLLRWSTVIGTILVISFIAVQYPHRLDRLTPNPAQFQAWWGPFLATTAGGFAFGKGIRHMLGLTSPLFTTLRSWLSVVAMLMLALEMVFFMAVTTVENNTESFGHYWQAFELAIVSAYFGTRA
ncbi:MAG: hypothetical protein LC104_11075 [Bacteroidales bacterium]|nr:hypothetical protein [Bacteroidales bacterium]